MKNRPKEKKPKRPFVILKNTKTKPEDAKALLSVLEHIPKDIEKKMYEEETKKAKDIERIFDKGSKSKEKSKEKSKDKKIKKKN